MGIILLASVFSYKCQLHHYEPSVAQQVVIKAAVLCETPPP